MRATASLGEPGPMLMIPISADKPLSFLEIARFWSRESTSTEQELRAALLCAWWLGELRGVEIRDRLTMLRALFKLRRDNFAFLGPGLPPSPNGSVDTPDGGAIVTMLPEVHVPGKDPEQWTEANCHDAFREMAEQWPGLEIESDEALAAPLLGMKLTSPEFFSWLQKRGAEAPAFWSLPDVPSRESTLAATEAATNACRKWLESEMRRGRQQQPKDDYFALSAPTYPTITRGMIGRRSLVLV